MASTQFQLLLVGDGNKKLLVNRPVTGGSHVPFTYAYITPTWEQPAI